MVCYNMYFFSRQGVCLHYQEWFRPKSVKQGAGTLVDDQKQMFGLFWTLSNFCATLDPRESSKPPLGMPRKIGQGCRFQSFTTNNYKLHYLETPTGIKMVLNTDREMGDLREVLAGVYEDIYVEQVVKNPLQQPGQPLASPEQFSIALNMYLRQRGLLQAQPIL